MAVIPYQPADLDHPRELVAAIRARRRGSLLNLDRMLLHSAPLTAGWNSFLAQVRENLSLAPHLRELVICAVAVLNEAPYEALHHGPEYLKAGGRAEQLDALRRLGRDDWTAQEFDENEQAVLELTLAMTRDIRVDRNTLERVMQVVDGHRQLVELVGVIAAYNMVSRFLVALDIDPEDGLALDSSHEGRSDPG